ncbi:DCMP deaminase [Mollivirus sibericum]|uniref:DCMP deaminase n=1 Tax=Mollivirus sibericum TaxID=1678078 RepID=UPI0006B2E06D|nr:DCMP deaminase [Mollivirus sibericum]ALD62298.1 DCMP deaminase [Mollivirus sibericum]
MKRANYIEWEDYFMMLALLSAQRSKDPNTQVGACIVNEDKRVVSMGYNGFPRGCNDDVFPWKRDSACEDILDSKSLYVVHAELNAILNKNAKSIKGCTVYVTLFPCCECTKAIIQSGITRVVYLGFGGKKHQPRYKASIRMLDAAGVEYVKHEPVTSSIHLDMRPAVDEGKSSTEQEASTEEEDLCSLLTGRTMMTMAMWPRALCSLQTTLSSMLKMTTRRSLRPT